MNALGHVATTMTHLDLPDVRLLRKALGIRLFEQRLLKLFSEGRLFGTVHTCIGQEWTGVAVAEHLQTADVIFSNHRCHGHYLARTGNYLGLLAEIMGREAGICKGRGGSQHICDGNVFSNGIQGGIVPVAAGIAYAQKLIETKDITVVFIGDGTLGEGSVYESMNIASAWELPLLIVLENNQYAQSTSQKQTLSGDIEARAQAFCIRTMRADTWNPEILIASIGEAVDYVRQMRRPLFFCVDTYRLMAHSKSDDNRDRAEVDSYWKRDLIYHARMTHPDIMQSLETELETLLDETVSQAEMSPISNGLEVLHTEPVGTWSQTKFESIDRVVNRIYAGLRTAMEQDERVILLGEDIEAPYGGAFKVTKDLSLRFPGRVRNTPISELSITGISNGLALHGMRPVTEIMFGDFVMLAADQWINHAAKFQYMYAGQVTVPLILRTPMGGKRGYGPTHSQSLEKHLLGVPGTRVLALHNRYDPALVYSTLLKEIDCPTLVIENKVLYGDSASAEAVAGYQWFHSSHRFPISYMRTDRIADLTILCMGGMLPDVEKAVEQLFWEHDRIADVICPLQLFPFQAEAILPIVQQSGRLLLIEEGHGFCGFTAEVLAELYERDASLKIRRLYSHPQHVPASKPLELEVLPKISRILEACLALESENE
jgi:2-oxoisovalerate dehydrogenase E1 component